MVGVSNVRVVQKKIRVRRIKGSERLGTSTLDRALKLHNEVEETYLRTTVYKCKILVSVEI